MSRFLSIMVGLSCIGGCVTTQAETQERKGGTYAIGDLHADLGRGMEALQLVGLVGPEGHWSGGSSILVQTGDITDRGPDGLQTLEFMERIQKEATAAGGRVIPLMGNHEAMNLMGDWRYVSPADVRSFGSLEARKEAFSSTGKWGQWLRQKGVAAQVGDTVFVHGGISAAFAHLPIEELSHQALLAIDGGDRSVLGENGPLWYRGYLLGEESAACQELGKALELLGAERMVVGHTTQRSGQIAVRCEGRLLGIDTGISDHYGANLSVLDLSDGDAWAVYPKKKTDIVDP
jgi:hypothetical protein